MTDQLTKTIRHCLQREFSLLPISKFDNKNDSIFFDNLSKWTIKYFEVKRNDNLKTIIETGIIEVKLKNFICKKYSESPRYYLIKYRVIIKKSDIFRPKCKFLEISPKIPFNQLRSAQQVDAPEPATMIFSASQHYIGRPGDL